MKKHLIILILIAATALAVLKTQAQDNKPVPNLLEMKTVRLHEKALRFADALHALSSQAQLRIAADGNPDLNTADLEFQGSAKEALNFIADKYDYSWTQTKTGIILLNRRFHRLDEYPQTNLHELQQMAKDVLTMLEGFRIPSEQSDAAERFQALMKAMTPLQQERLKGGRIYDIASLNSEQTALVRQAIAANLFGKMWPAWEAFSQRLNAIPGATLQLQPLDAKEQKGSYLYLHYQGPDGHKQHYPWFSTSIILEK